MCGLPLGFWVLKMTMGLQMYGQLVYTNTDIAGFFTNHDVCFILVRVQLHNDGGVRKDRLVISTPMKWTELRPPVALVRFSMISADALDWIAD